MFPTEDTLEGCHHEVSHLIKEEAKQTFADLINHFLDLSQQMDAGYVDEDISFHYRGAAFADVAVFLPFFVETTNIVIHVLKNGGYNLEITEETGTTTEFFDSSSTTYDEVLLMIERATQKLGTGDSRPEENPVLMLFKEDTADHIQYPMVSDEESLFYNLSLAEQYVAGEFIQTGDIFSSFLKNGIPIQIQSLANNEMAVSLFNKDGEFQKKVPVNELHSYIQKI